MNTDLLRVALAKKNLPQIAIAKLLGIDGGTFSRWKRWYTVPKKYRTRIAQLLEVSEDELFPEIKVEK